jgi:peptidoglycan-associated lipoprotein
MKKFVNIALLVLIIPALMFTVSCQKKISAQAPGQVAPVAVKAAPPASPLLMGETKVDVAAPMVYFDFDKAVLKPEYQAALKIYAESLKKNKTAIRIEGNCDERGTNEYNMALGDRRANSVKSFLVDLGVPASQLLAVSNGEEKPTVKGHDEAAWAKNRNAQIFVAK